MCASRLRVLGDLVVPKRSNEFQRLVHLIFEHLAPSARVQESALVLEVGLPTPTKREVDVLIEDEIAGVLRRMAVECRDRARKDEIGWIDCLIGKYSHLPIDKIVAVSKSGLTRAAIEKAAAHKIEVKILEDAMEVDWREEFCNLVPGALVANVSVVELAVVSDPALPEGFDPSLFTCIQKGVRAGSLSEVVSGYANQQAARFLRDEFGKTYQTVADLDKIARIEARSHPEDEVTLEGSDGSAYRLEQLVVVFELRTELKKGEVNYFKFGRAGVSVGSVELQDGKVFTVTTVQAAGDSKARVKVEQREKKRRTASRSKGRKPSNHTPSSP
jgi:hypothetical protein